MHDVLPALILTVGSIVTAVCVMVVRLQPYRQARHFGDIAATSTGKRALRAQQLARDYSRRRHPEGEPVDDGDADG
jgi:hypothetical protein